MINISNLAVQFGGDFLFQNMNIAIHKKDKIGLIGRNGAGKSTLLKIMNGELQPDSGSVEFSGDVTISYLRQDIQLTSDLTVFEETKTAFAKVQQLLAEISDLEKKIGVADHNEVNSYNKMLNQLSEKNELLHYLGYDSMDENIARVLNGLGFEDPEFEKRVNQLSGGWQMRVELAKMLLRKPDLLMLDEPTNHLDIESIIWLEDFLKNYPGAVVLISHDTAFLDNVCNRTIEILKGNVIDFKSNYSVYMEMRAIRQEHQTLAKKNQEKYRARLKENVNKFRAKKNKAKFAQTLIRKLDKMEIIEVEDIQDYSKVKLNFPDPEKSGKVVYKAIHLEKSFGENHVIKDANFQIERGDRVAFVGKNGMGKTTLSKVLTGNLEYQGTLETGFRVNIGYFEQYQAESLDGNRTVLQTIEDVATGDLRARARSLLGAFLFSGDDVEKKVKILSGGEKSRLAMAKLLTQPYNVLILDEPTNHLDMSTKEILKNALSDFSGTLILVSHDRDFLEGLTSKVYEFTKSGIKEHLGDIYDFLEAREASSFREYEADKEKVVSKQSGNETESDHKKWYQDKKDAEKEMRKFQKKVSGCEREITSIEKKISKIEEELMDPVKYQDLSKDAGFFKKYEDLKTALNEKMEQWENFQQSYEKSQSILKKINDRSLH
ncbi:MAG: ABC-F family ATP-binding cassette domain-containing protein [Chitinophagales bacterium]|nr:ABC-F family ATP-binding cassette domain-containing protein [Chitinophagales bacterium]